ncbi:MAG TPA: sigma 54-interacting transcriptional regulator [Myxococcales bacterium LLY-WYZ-16_1]|nr:sigma 54-interacting transcriptional regulator [Myxococcales bacterium LLY-WYZ-16_1]
MSGGHTTTLRRPASELGGPLDWTVTVVSSPDRAALAQQIRLDGSELLVGRSPECTFRIADASVSRRHVRIFLPIGVERFWLEDLGGSNGTFIDGALIRGKVGLEGHECIWIGDSVLVVEKRPTENLFCIAPDVTGEKASAFRGVSMAADHVRKALETAATSEGAVLLLGPSGSGKEVSARIVHELSGRTGPFVPVNCAAIPSELAESELFGHERGAFTGADQAREGHFRAADGGTLFLDELGELPLPLQAKLLRVLETDTVTPIAGRPKPVDVKIVAATHRAIDDEEDAFRRDLWARLSDWVVRLPPLERRRADVLPLFEHFLERALGRSLPRTPRFDAAVTAYPWPLNVRELEKVARRLARLAGPKGRLDVPDLPPPITAMLHTGASAPEDRQSTPAPPEPARRTAPISIPSKEELEHALRESAGNVKAMAEAKGWHRMQVYRWMRRHGLDPTQYR